MKQAIQLDFPLDVREIVETFSRSNACSYVQKDDRIILVTPNEKIAARAKKEITTPPIAESPFPSKTFRLPRLDDPGIPPPEKTQNVLP